MTEYLRAEGGVAQLAIAGSLRRYKETIGDIDIVVAGDTAAPIFELFAQAPTVERVLARGDTKCSVIVDRGLQIDLRVVPARSFGAALLYFTGSKEHNVRLRGLALRRKLLLNEYGLYRVGAEARGQEIASLTEEAVYAALEMDFIPPELREDRGEIDAAVETGTWIEVNGGPERLDLPDTWIRKAVDRGATLVTNSDAHAIEELDWMDLAVGTARRGWAAQRNLANVSGLDAMLALRKKH